MKRMMSANTQCLVPFLMTSPIVLAHPLPSRAKETAPVVVPEHHTQRDGQHDFDFEIGTWKTHLKRLLHPLSGSTTWVEYDGTTTVVLGGGRVSKVVLTGDVRQHSAKSSEAAGGGAHVAFDQVGGATDPNATIAVLRSLKRGGRLVLMGSMSTPVPIDYGEVMINNWGIIGNFMYPADAYPLALRLMRAGLLNLDAVRIRLFPFSELPAAMDAAERMQGLECTVLSFALSGEQFANVCGPGT